MSRQARLWIHARAAGTEPATWDDPSLVQVWGPRLHEFVLAAGDQAVFTRGVCPTKPGLPSVPSV